MLKRALIAAALALGLSPALAQGIGPAPSGNCEYDCQPNLGQIGVTRALMSQADGSGVGIAFLDGYIHPTLFPDLAGKTQVVLAYNLFRNTYWKIQNQNHATVVASIAAGNLNGSGMVGVAPGASVYSYPIWDDYGYLTYAGGPWSWYGWQWDGNFNQIYQNVAWQHPDIRVVSESLGYGNGIFFGPGKLDTVAAYRDSFVAVLAIGGTTAAPAYTDNTDGHLSNILLVNSLNVSGQLSSVSWAPGENCFRNYWQANVCAESDKIKYSVVVAPGENILGTAMSPNGTVGTRVFALGTSWAVPEVSGVAALVFSDALKKNVPLTPSQVVQIIEVTATDLGAPGVDGIYGWGEINATRALSPIGPLTGAVPAPISGQVAFDSFGRPYAVAPQLVPMAPLSSLVAPMGQPASLQLHGGWSFTTRGAIEPDVSALSLGGFTRAFKGFSIGLTAGVLAEDYALLGYRSERQGFTTLANLDASWHLGSLGFDAFYARGSANGLPADSYGLGASWHSWSLNLSKPLSVISAVVPTGRNLDGGIRYERLSADQPWLAVVQFKRSF